jgi:hypothetical protein
VPAVVSDDNDVAAGEADGDFDFVDDDDDDDDDLAALFALDFQCY